MSNLIKTGNIVIGRGSPLVLVSGPCVIEDYETTREIAGILKEITSKLKIPFIFKASYDKANRTSIAAFRGPGLNDGLRVLKEIKAELDIPILSDVHRISEIPAAARILDIIQIPAFLCRQTDVVMEVAKTGKPVNIKKGQFLAPLGYDQCCGKNHLCRQPPDIDNRAGKRCLGITTWLWISAVL